MSNIIRNFGVIFASIWFWMFLLYVFIPQAKFKLITALVTNFGNGITYYDLVTPLFLLIILSEVYVGIVKAKVTGP